MVPTVLQRVHRTHTTLEWPQRTTGTALHCEREPLQSHQSLNTGEQRSAMTKRPEGLSQVSLRTDWPLEYRR